MRIFTIAAAVALGSAPALAQTGMVTVSVPNAEVLGDFLTGDQAAGMEIPMTVQMPVRIASNACGIDADELVKTLKGGAASCTATTGSRSLAEALIKHGGEKKPAAEPEPEQ